MECDEIPGSDPPEPFFSGVRFVLVGFDPVSESQYRAELLQRGAVDAGKYGDSCTHVIVSGRVYDDPLCVAARADGKMLVTELWIEDSVDFSAPADARRVLYHPVRDFNGIPGSDKLCICLTGYQRRERDDIMKMVELIGAHFSKPLIATKITHLICYKFEGEKYELAKKVNIKLVNHRWLEDCLKAWKVLPEDDYARSGWELEMEEAEAKDSEEETDAGKMKSLLRGSGSSRISTPQNHMEKSRNLEFSVQAKSMSQMGKSPISILSRNEKNHMHIIEDNRGQQSPGSSVNRLATLHQPVDALTLKKTENRLSLATRTLSGAASTTPNNSSRKGKKSLEPGAAAVESLGHLDDMLGNTVQIGSNSTVSLKQQDRHGIEPFDTELAPANLLVDKIDVSPNQLPQKRKAEFVDKFPSLSHTKPRMSGSSSPSANTGPLKTDSPSVIVGGAKYCLDIADKRSPLSQVNFRGSPGGHDVGLSTSVSSSYKIRHVEKRQPLFGVKKTDVLVTDQLSKDSDRAMEDVSKCSTPSGSLPVLDTGSLRNTYASADVQLIVPSHSGSGDALMNNNLTILSKELGGKVIDDNISSGPSEGENSTVVLCDASTKSEMKKHDDPNIQNASSNIQEGSGKEHVSKPDETMLNAEGVPPIAVGGTLAHKLGTASNKVKKVATKKLGNRPKVAHKISMKNDATNSAKKKPNDEASLDLEKKEVKHVMAGLSNIPSESLPDENVKAADMMEGIPKRSSTNGSKKFQTDAMDGNKKLGKENLPLSDHLQINSNCITKVDNKHGGILQKEPNKVSVTCSKDNNDQCNKKALLEPVCFLLCGHRLQRKEFRQVIRHLRGKVCRDSHQWSYQATHFVVPDPVRRTEKFFAAAASGRWILKTDYLTASNEAGRFLEEESFEWHKNGLTEDGAINLAAPRKWRRLRERTGHGALYGMRIIIYGECIMPSLDTLKRVVKAGDGIILATSPPYTRFLSSGVDFAIISPGMPRVDVWIQEFMRHKIPCVLADYLVEYVCKPGYPLERHVLFNTQAWAAKSFANLQSRLEEVVCNDAPPAEEDIPCAACGSRDRADVMLICGNEAGTVGCGIGMHIDCCDPPLDAVPEEDWFCCKCSESRTLDQPIKEKKKRKTTKKLR